MKGYFSLNLRKCLKFKHHLNYPHIPSFKFIRQVIKGVLYEYNLEVHFSWTDGAIILGKISDSPFSKIASETPRKM